MDVNVGEVFLFESLFFLMLTRGEVVMVLTCLLFSTFARVGEDLVLDSVDVHWAMGHDTGVKIFMTQSKTKK